MKSMYEHIGKCKTTHQILSWLPFLPCEVGLREALYMRPVPTKSYPRTGPSLSPLGQQWGMECKARREGAIDLGEVHQR
jgi:hypothetical protein